MRSDIEDTKVQNLFDYFEEFLSSQDNNLSLIFDTEFQSNANDFAERVYNVEIVLRLYVMPVIVFLSLICNVVVFIPLCRVVSSSTACPLFIYSLFILIFDIILLVTVPGVQWLEIKVGSFARRMRTSSAISCHLSLMFDYLVLSVDHWLIVCLVAHSFALTFRPKLALTASRSDVKDIILLVVAVLAFVSMHHFWTYNLQSSDSDNVLHNMPQCIVRSHDLEGKLITYGQFIAQISWMTASAIPASFLLVLLLLLCRFRHMDERKLFKAFGYRFRRHQRQQDHQLFRNNNQNFFSGCYRSRIFRSLPDQIGFEDILDKIAVSFGSSYVTAELCMSTAHIVDVLIVNAIIRNETVKCIWPVMIVVANMVEAFYLGLPALLLVTCSRKCRQEVVNVAKITIKCFRTKCSCAGECE